MSNENRGGFMPGDHVIHHNMSATPPGFGSTGVVATDEREPDPAGYIWDVRILWDDAEARREADSPDDEFDAGYALCRSEHLTLVDVLADPIPGQSVWDNMPGNQGLSGPLEHFSYLTQIRDGGMWRWPNHDEPAEMTAFQVLGAVHRARNRNDARASVAGWAIYLSDGRQAARYIPTAQVTGYLTGTCPGCCTSYEVNGDGPCPATADPKPPAPFHQADRTGVGRAAPHTEPSGVDL